MRTARTTTMLFSGMTLLSACAEPAEAPAQSKRLLVVTHTQGYRHSSIAEAERVLASLGQAAKRWEVAYCRTAADVADMLTPDGLKRFDGVVFANTTGDLPVLARGAFYDWIRGGKAFVGMHSASDTFHGDPVFNELLGGEFLKHGRQCEVEARVEDAEHPATKPLGTSYKIFDEIYLFKKFSRDRVRVLLSLGTHPPDGSDEGNARKPGDYPLAWCREFGQGRSFYTALGHREDTWGSALYQAHVAGGIEWALGLKAGSAAPNPKPSAAR